MPRPKLRVSPNDVFVFWTYDLFPYMLGGKADMSRRKGSLYYVTGYGAYYRPFAVLDGIPGAKLLLELENMREEHRIAKRDVDETFRRKLVERLRKNKIDHPAKHVNEPRR